MKILSLLALAALVASCHLPHEPGPQPSWLDNQRYEPTLNVFGLLRAEVGASFVHVERAYQMDETEEQLDFNLTITQVAVTRLSDGIVYYFEADSAGNEDFRHDTFSAVHGETYWLEVIAVGFDTLTGTTTVPPPVVVVTDQLQVSDGDISFELQGVAEIYLYDILLFTRQSADGDTTARSLRMLDQTGTDRLPVVLDYDVNIETPLYVEIFGYDANLTDYGLAPISIKPQTYNADQSTVQGGYGCFGALSVGRVAL